MEVFELTKTSEDVFKAMNRLLPQLTPSSATFSKDDLDEIIHAESTSLFIAVDVSFTPAIIGALTLLLFRIPSGKVARIEDVVVDEKARRRGVGRALTLAAIAKAESEGAKAVDLTSNPARTAANRLYARLGFVRRETNVYRLSFVRE